MLRATPAAGSGPTWSFVGVGESKGEREQGHCQDVSWWLVSGVVGGEQAIWLAEVLGKRSHAAVDDVGAECVDAVSTGGGWGQEAKITRCLCLDIHDGSLQVLCTSVISNSTLVNFLQFVLYTIG